MNKAILPLRHTFISQAMNGALSHKGTKAIDFGSLSTYKDYNLYAPFDGTVVWADSIAKGAAIAFQSDYPVEYADGTVDYMTVITGHDNTRPSAGSKFKQGQLYSHQGTAGGVNRHTHLEVQRGKFKKPTKTIPQQFGNVYYFENTIEPYKALFITEDTIIRPISGGSVVEYPWKVNNMGLIKIIKDPDYDYKWSVDGNRYNTKYDTTIPSGFGDTKLVEEGWEEILAVNGSLFFKTTEGGSMAEGLEKSRGVNNQELEMTGVSDYNTCMSVAGVPIEGSDSIELYFASQQWVIDNVLDRAYCAITGMGLMLGGALCGASFHKNYSEWNAISGRTVIGEDKDGNIMSYSFAGETGKSGLTGALLQSEVKKLGFYNAVCFDGGGSVWRRVNGQYDIKTTRPVKNALLLYRRKKQVAEKPVEPEDPVKDSVEVNDLKNQIIKLQESLKEKDKIAVELQAKCNDISTKLKDSEAKVISLEAKLEEVNTVKDELLKKIDEAIEVLS